MNVVKFKRPGRSDTKLDYSTFVQMQEWLERIANCAFSQDFVVDKTGVLRVGLRKMEAEMNYSDFAFGFSVSSATVTVKGGYLFHGTRAAITVSGKVISVPADNTYVYVAYVFGSGSASIAFSTIFPQHTETTLNWLLHKITLTGDIASIEAGNIHHLGSIHIPGNFA